MKTVLYIEPHCDDLVQSSTELLMDPDNDITVITFDDSDERSSLSYSQFAAKITAIKIASKEIHFNYAQVFAEEPELIRSEYDECYAQIIKGLKLINPQEQFDIGYFPLGLYHPHHITVSDAVKNFVLRTCKEVYKYIDQPYFVKFISDSHRTSISEFNEIIEVPTPEISREEIMRKCFKAKHLTSFEHRITSSKYIRIK